MQTHTVAATEAGLVASICRASFFDFVKEFWSVNIPEKPVWNWHIPFLCAQLQFMAERVFRGEPKKHDLICNISPGTSKSTIFSTMFPAWVWTRMPTARFICASYTYPLALDLSRKCRDIIESDKYRACFPEVSLRADQNTKGHYTNTQNGMRYAIGVGGSVIGMHAHFLIVDDPIDPLATSSDDELATVNQWMTETLPSRKVDKELAVTMLVMQRLHQNDPTGNILNDPKTAARWRHICLPAELTSKPNVSPKFLIQRYHEGLMDPRRLNRRVLSDALETLKDYGYACQHLQTPIPRGGGMFKVDKMLIQRPPAKFKRVVRYWDKAGTSRGGAFTVGVKMATDENGQFWVLDVIRGQWDSFERELLIKRVALADGRNVVVGIEQEPGSGGKESAEATVKRLAGFTVVVSRPTGDKELRADPFSTQVNAGNVFLAPGPWNAEYIKELEYFPFGTYMDQVDGSSGAFTVVTTKRRRVGAL